MIVIDCDSEEQELRIAKGLAELYKEDNPNWGFQVYRDVYAIEGRRVWSNDE